MNILKRLIDKYKRKPLKSRKRRTIKQVFKDFKANSYVWNTTKRFITRWLI